MVLAGVDEVARLVGVQQPRLKGHVLQASLKNEYNLWLKKWQTIFIILMGKLGKNG